MEGEMIVRGERLYVKYVETPTSLVQIWSLLYYQNLSLQVYDMNQLKSGMYNQAKFLM